AIFVAVILGATQARANTTLAPLAIGLTFAVVITVALPLTNASMNPARSTAAAFFAEPWAAGQLWLFWVAPLLGAAVAGLLYRAFAVSVPAEAGLVSAAVENDEIAAAAQAPSAEAENDAEAGAKLDAAGPAVGSDAGSATSGDSGEASPAGAAGAGYGRTNAGLPKPVPASAPQEQAPANSDAQDFFDNPQPRN
ncbi:MAG TPA: aquaporin, partial [Micrococcaceae bacterium]